MGKAKKTRKFAQVKRIMNPKDTRIRSVQKALDEKEEKKPEAVRHIQQVSSSLFFKYNTALKPPYQVLVDTNFINFSIQNKLELVKSMLDCLYAKCELGFFRLCTRNYISEFIILCINWSVLWGNLLILY